MGINYVHSGLLAAVGIQLPAVQLGPQELRPGPEGRTVLREIWASPGVWEKKEKKGCQEPIGCPCWGGPRTVREPHSVGGRNLFWGAEKTEWRGHCGLGYRSLAEPGGVKGCEHKVRSIEIAPCAVL